MCKDVILKIFAVFSEIGHGIMKKCVKYFEGL